MSLRLPNIYGFSQYAINVPDRNIINKIIESCIYSKKIDIYGTGEYIRDYFYIDDLTVRLSLYEQLVGDKTNFQFDIFLKNIEDRFGPAPQMVKDLLLGVLLKNKINNPPSKFISVSANRSEFIFTLKEHAQINRNSLESNIDNIEIGNRKIYLKGINNENFDWRKALIELVDLVHSGG